ncbi:MAG: hypothetical protein NZ938_05240, partial [Aigarchaeota archaeon]|nr:hypothetical protein [Candidatus Calditenuaceae archaeon]
MRIDHYFAVAIYPALLVLLVYITPLYGDPAVVFWTGKVMHETGFAYDPVCTKNQAQLCVRAPLYYSILATTRNWYWIAQATILLLFIYLQLRLTRLLSINSSVFGLMVPPVYLLFSRTYVDSLTALLSTCLLYSLVKHNSVSRLKKALFLASPALLVLTRETALILPLLFALFALYVKETRWRTISVLLISWATGLMAYLVYVLSSGGSTYADFQPHVPSLAEAYRALMWIFTPILPWEIRVSDVESYLSYIFPTKNTGLSLFLTTLMGTFSYVIAVVFMIPLLLAVRRLKDLSGHFKAQLVFGALAALGLLFLKGDIDYYRHLAYILPVMPSIASIGIQELRRKNKPLATLFTIVAIAAFALYIARTARSHLAGYEFDTCEYLSKRPEISGIE